MRTASTSAVIALCLLSVSGCERKAKVMPSPQAEAPILPPSKMVHVPTLPTLPPPPLRDVVVASTQPENPEPVHTRKPARRKPSSTKASATGDAPAQGGDKAAQAPPIQASTGVAPEVSPIGQLSSTSGVSTSQDRNKIERLISDTESGLNKVNSTLNSEEQLTATQIKTFLTKAKQALTDNDLDGAFTLANKAKELLGELTKK